MPQFQYRALTSDGSTLEGSLFAASTSEAIATLTKKGWTATRLRVAESRWPSWNVPSLAQQAAWFSMFSDLLGSGMPLAKSLEILAEQTSQKFLAEATHDLRSRVLQGESLSNAMRNHPKLFRTLEIALVGAGEEGAFLDIAMERLSDVKKSTAAMRAKLLSASAYPSFLLLVGSLVLSGMLLFFVPKFEPLFERMKELGTLPIATRTLFAMTHFLSQYGIFVLGGFIAILATTYSYLQGPKGLEARDRWLLRSPMLGPWIQSLVLSRFCHLLGTLLTSGVKIQRAILIAGQGCGNLRIEEASRSIVERVTAGSNLADSLEREKEFPKETVEMIRVGEQTNRLDRVLLSTSQRLDARNQQTLEIGLKLIEPMLMALMAAIIGFLMMALLLPIFNASGQTFQ